MDSAGSALDAVRRVDRGYLIGRELLHRLSGVAGLAGGDKVERFAAVPCGPDGLVDSLRRRRRPKNFARSASR